MFASSGLVLDSGIITYVCSEISLSRPFKIKTISLVKAVFFPVPNGFFLIILYSVIRQPH